MQDNIQRTLGNLEGTINEGFKAINNRLDKINGTIIRHEDKLNVFETFKDNLRGQMTIIGAVTGFIGAIVTMVINKFINKN